MKNIWKKIVVVLALLGASSLSSARGAVSVYAEEAEPSSNATVTTTETATDTNAPSTTTHRKHRTSSDEDHPPVRIDETGIHVGGANPVDINVPDFKHSHLLNFVDMTGIIAILSTFGMPVMIILIVFYFRHRRNKLAHETLRTMIEKGVPMTPELVAEVRGQGAFVGGNGRPRNGSVFPGLVLAGIGAALLISNRGHSTGGWVVLFIGIAFLVTWSIERKNPNNVLPPR